MTESALLIPGQVGIIHYTLRDDAGEVLDSSADGEPMAYLHGGGNIVPGLEKALEGKAVGDKVTVSVPPEDGYGLPSGVEPTPMPLSQLPPGAGVGAQLIVQNDKGGRRPVWISRIEGNQGFLSFDHPLSGKTLHFTCEVVGIRPATADEKTHGHAHGVDGRSGHHHHHDSAPGRAPTGKRSLARKPAEKSKKGKK
jgi:FKBP-type peptidyl-prolyl cis-trans isomerase SlyD